MKRTLATLEQEGRAAAVDPDIAALDEVFDLVNTREGIELEETGYTD